MTPVRPRGRQRQLLFRHLELELRKLLTKVMNELEPLGVVRVGYFYCREPRVLSDARMNLRNALGYQDHDVVFFQQSRACNPALKGYEVGAIVARHVAHVAGGNDCIQKIDDNGNLLAVQQEVLDQRQRASRLLWKLSKRVAAHQRIGYAKQSRERTLSFG